MVAEFGVFWFICEVVCVKNPEMQKSFVDKLESLRKLLNSRLPEPEMRHLKEIMGKLGNLENGLV